MFYVYLIKSIKDPRHKYVGYTSDFKRRFSEHNRGHSRHTRKFMPWQIVAVFCFCDESTARLFEKYLKTESGKAFSKKRFAF